MAEVEKQSEASCNVTGVAIESGSELDKAVVSDMNDLGPVTHHHNICQPISQLSHVWSYLDDPPSWAKQTLELQPRSSGVVKNAVGDCHVKVKDFLPKSRLDRNLVPRTLVCHDMKGGYIEDKYIGPVNISNGYTFYRWNQIDIFVYFSHHLITIPPLPWINIAHSNGVKILGTFITEWKDGEAVCQTIFSSMEMLKEFVNILVEICVLFKLDGWLVNIENKVDNPVMLKEFVSTLTERLHLRKPGSLVIWYDSVTENGKLSWQNELNSKNRCFFDLCDGIFTNYSWNEKNLINCVREAQHRVWDVYVGVDVFGRNFYQGGKYNTFKALQKIREQGLSLAIFAPGWTHETLPAQPSGTVFERFLNRDNFFWQTLWPYLYTHPITVAFNTSFHIGAEKDIYKLQAQEVQLSKFLYSNDGHAAPSLEETCDCLSCYLDNGFISCQIKKRFGDRETYVHHLFSCSIRVLSDVILYAYTKSVDQDTQGKDYLTLVLLVRNFNGSYKKILCYSGDWEPLQNNATVMEVSPTTDPRIIHICDYKNKVPPDWNLRCYLLSIQNVEILEIGAVLEDVSSVNFCGIGFKDTNLLKND